jgi:hypothetical protein
MVKVRMITTSESSDIQQQEPQTEEAIFCQNINPSSKVSSRGASPPHNLSQEEEITSGDSSILEMQRHRLLQLRHAIKCVYTQGTCPISPYCGKLKILWKHLLICKNDYCQIPLCTSSRYVLYHYGHCKNLTCAVCIPVKDTYKRSHTDAEERELLKCPPKRMRVSRSQVNFEGLLLRASSNNNNNNISTNNTSNTTTTTTNNQVPFNSFDIGREERTRIMKDDDIARQDMMLPFIEKFGALTSSHNSHQHQYHLPPSQYQQQNDMNRESLLSASSSSSSSSSHMIIMNNSTMNSTTNITHPPHFNFMIPSSQGQEMNRNNMNIMVSISETPFKKNKSSHDDLSVGSSSSSSASSTVSRKRTNSGTLIVSQQHKEQPMHIFPAPPASADHQNGSSDHDDDQEEEEVDEDDYAQHIDTADEMESIDEHTHSNVDMEEDEEECTGL